MAREQAAEMHFARNVGLVLTYKCQIACPHCVLEASPKRTEQTALVDALDWVEQIAAYRSGHVRFLSLTGGEPFVDLAALARISAHAAERGLLVSVATNGFWAATPQRAAEILKELPGVRLLSVSTDAHHQAFIGIDRVRNVVVAASEAGIPCRIAVCTESREDSRYRATLGELARFADPRDVDTTITFPAGRALTTFGARRPPSAARPPPAACTAAAAPILFPDGRVLGCVGPVMTSRTAHPLLLGDLRRESLERILDRAEHNAVLHALRIWGPRKLVEAVERDGPCSALPESYAADSPCAACGQLFGNPRIAEYLTGLAMDATFRERIALARLYYMDEAEMLGGSSAVVPALQLREAGAGALDDHLVARR